MQKPMALVRGLCCSLLIVGAAVNLHACATRAGAHSVQDPYLWLEDVTGAKALEWVRAQNALSTKELEMSPQFKPLYDRLLAILDSDARIPYVAKHGPFYYNFWRDARHVRGLYRRTTLDEYAKAEPDWEVVLDVDALASQENENWVWKGIDCIHPQYDRCLIRLSRGGGDAVVVREFDVVSKRFATDGFALPEAKSRIAWRDRDNVFVGTDFGPGSLTTSGYPRLVKLWKRGTPLTQATLVFEGQPTDVSVQARTSNEPGYHRELIHRTISAFTGETFLLDGDQLIKLDVPLDAKPGTYRDQLVVELRTDWTPRETTYPAGALIAMNLSDFIAGRHQFDTLAAPGPRRSLGGISSTRSHVILTELENVNSRLYVLNREDDIWKRSTLPAPAFGTLSVSAVDEFESDDYFLTSADFLTPTSLYLGTVGKPERQLLKQLPAFFNGEGLEISQHEAVSKDGSRVPYFQVARKALPLDGSHATLLYGYGGFEISQRPSYSTGIGAAWLERGGVYVLANIRGGGEFGPAWHEAAIKENRQRAYDDFIAIAEDLIARKVTSPKHLGIMGGSNGGLLMGVMLTQRPDLFGAIVCQVPLLDMRRYSKLLAGASWMGEYGDPDKPEDWAYLQKYSPYHNVVKDRNYPRVLFTTSTRDDRVHPGHARKMAAKMKEQGNDILYYENIEGGHGGAANNQQQAYMNALAFTFLLKELR